MEHSKNFNFFLPSRDTDDIVDINRISDNFRIIDGKLFDLVSETVDQTFEPTSENAQSGKAVAQAVDAAFQTGATYIFDGGDAYSEIDVTFTLDNGVTPESENAVKSKGIYTAISDAIESAKKGAEELIFDYPIEYGTSGVWTYEKWKSGKYVLSACETISSNGEETDAAAGWKTFSRTLSFPNDLFTENNKPNVHIQIEQNSNTFPTVVNISELSDTTMTYRIFRVQDLPADFAMTSHIEVKGRWRE